VGYPNKERLRKRDGGVGMRKTTNFVLVMILLSQLFLGGCTSDKQTTSADQESIKPINVMTVKEEKYQDDFSVSGNVKPSKTVKMAFKTAGVLQNICVQEGDFVKQNQLIAYLDDHQYGLNVMAANSNYESLRLKMESEIPSAVNQAKSQLDLMTKRYESIQRLYEKGAVSKDKLDEVETGLITVQNKYQEALDARAIYEKQLKQAQAMSELADSNLADTKLFSPMEGYVVKKLMESGETVAPGYPVVVLGQLGEIEVEIGVPDAIINKLKIGEKAKVFVYGIEKEFEGSISEIGTTADTQTRVFPVKIKINNKDLVLKPGMVAKVTIALGNKKGIFVPVDSIMKMPEGSVIFVYSPEKSRVLKRKVALGELIKDNVEIKKGLKPGEKVVIKGQLKLKDKDQVKVEE
jgi:RND family efflux transporter MFP subunit